MQLFTSLTYLDSWHVDVDCRYKPAIYTIQERFSSPSAIWVLLFWKFLPQWETTTITSISPPFTPVICASMNKPWTHLNSVVWIGPSHFVCFSFVEPGLDYFSAHTQDRYRADCEEISIIFTEFDKNCIGLKSHTPPLRKNIPPLNTTINMVYCSLEASVTVHHKNAPHSIMPSSVFETL